MEVSILLPKQQNTSNKLPHCRRFAVVFDDTAMSTVLSYRNRLYKNCHVHSCLDGRRILFTNR